MAWTGRAVLLVVVSLLALNGIADAKRKPPLRGACQLVTTAEVTKIMGRKMVKSPGSAPTGCGWRSGPKAEAALQLYGFKTLTATKQYFDGVVQGYELCIDPPDHFLPGSGLGDDAWRDACASNIVFRVGRLVGEVTTFTDDVVQGSSADTRRTAAIARKAVKRLRKLRCPPSFCRGT
jgi:hypothetical protein